VASHWKTEKAKNNPSYSKITKTYNKKQAKKTLGSLEGPRPNDGAEKRKEGGIATELQRGKFWKGFELGSSSKSGLGVQLEK